MKLKTYGIALALVGVAAGLCGCSTSGNVDARYPTVQQMDDLDVQWGLSRRKPRGTPSRVFNYDPQAVRSGAGVEAPALPDPPLDPQ